MISVPTLEWGAPLHHEVGILMIVAILGAAGGSLFEWRHGDQLTGYGADYRITWSPRCILFAKIMYIFFLQVTSPLYMY